MRQRIPILAAALILSAGGAWAQGSSAPQLSSKQEAAPGALPGPFVEEEKAPFLKGLRRFEIVAFGSFPIMLFYANLGFDLSRYIRSGYDAYYAPWPLKSEYSYSASTSEILSAIGTAALLSVGVGTLDAIIRSIRKSGRRERPPRVDSP